MMVSRRKHVRVHQDDDGPTIEGVLVGKPWRHAGHYVVRKAGVLVAEGVTVAPDGPEVWIPRERVLFVEVLR